MADINLWSVDAANNNMTPPHGWPEGMNYSAVNDAARENMAAIKRWFDDISGKLDATGQANIYAVTLNAGYSSYFRGMMFRCKIPATNTGASTIDVNAIGPRNIVRADGSALEAGMLRQGHAYSFYFDGTNFRVDATTLVPDGALSSNVPLKNAPNVFTVQQTIQRADGSPTLTVEHTSSAVNAVIEAKTTGGSVYFGNSNGSAFAIGASNNLTSAPWVSVSGTEFEVNADLLDFNGNADISGTLAVGGAATFSNNVTVGGTISGNGSGLTNLNASNLSSGTVPDGVLSNNVPRLNAPNTFTAPAQTISASSSAILSLVHTGADPDEKRVDLKSQSGTFSIYAVNDASNTFPGLLVATRNGVSWTSLELTASTITLNGVPTTDFARLSQPNVFTSSVNIFGKDGSHGYVTATQGSDTNPGYIEFVTSDNIRRAYMGWSTGQGHIQLVTENGWGLSISADPLWINGVNFNDYARQSQPNTFGATQVVAFNGSARFAVDDVNASGVAGFVLRSNGIDRGGLFIDEAGSFSVDTVFIYTNARPFKISTNGLSSFCFALDTSGNLTTPNASAAEVGFKGAPHRDITASTNTAASDAGGTIKMIGGASGQTLTLTSAPPTDSVIVLYNKSSQGWTIAASASLTWAATGTTGNRTLAPGGLAVAYHDGAGNWVIGGNGLV